MLSDALGLPDALTMCDNLHKSFPGVRCGLLGDHTCDMYRVVDLTNAQDVDNININPKIQLLAELSRDHLAIIEEHKLLSEFGLALEHHVQSLGEQAPPPDIDLVLKSLVDTKTDPS